MWTYSRKKSKMNKQINKKTKQKTNYGFNDKSTLFIIIHTAHHKDNVCTAY